MRYFWLFMLGLLVGLGLAGAVIWLTPLTAEPRHAPTLAYGVTAQFATSLRAEDAPLLTHGGERRLIARPESVSPLWEATIQPVVAGLLLLRNDAGEVIGSASRLGAASRDTDPLRQGILVDSTWLVSLDGQGMAFVIQRENVWPMLRQVVIPARLRREPWQGALSFTPAAGPREDAAGRLLGISGTLAGLEGQLISSYRMTAFDPTVGPTGLSMHTVLSLPLPLPVAGNGDADAAD